MMQHTVKLCKAQGTSMLPRSCSGQQHARHASRFQACTLAGLGGRGAQCCLAVKAGARSDPFRGCSADFASCQLLS
jgi:hypothetical protein